MLINEILERVFVVLNQTGYRLLCSVHNHGRNKVILQHDAIETVGISRRNLVEKDQADLSTNLVMETLSNMKNSHWQMLCQYSGHVQRSFQERMTTLEPEKGVF